MGRGFWVLLWDDWGIGLNMINPRMLEVNGENWFRYDGSLDKAVAKLNLDSLGCHYKVIE